MGNEYESCGIDAVELNFSLVDGQGESVDVFCEVIERGESAYWRAWLYGSATLLDTFDGRAMDESVIAGQIQAEIMLRDIHVSA